MKEYKINLTTDEMNIAYRAVIEERNRVFKNYKMFRDEGFPLSAEECEKTYNKLEALSNKFNIDKD